MHRLKADPLQQSNWLVGEGAGAIVVKAKAKAKNKTQRIVFMPISMLVCLQPMMDKKVIKTQR